MKKPILLIVALLLVSGIGIGLYMWNKPKRTAEDEKPVETISATQLYNAFVADEAASNARFLNKTIQVSGTVESVSTDGKGDLVINFATNADDGGIVSATFSETKAAKPEPGTEVVLKGICAGYIAGDLLGGEVQLSQCAMAQ